MLEMQGALIRMDCFKTSNDDVECEAFYDQMIVRCAGDEKSWEIFTQEDHWFAQHCFKTNESYIDTVLTEVLFMPILFEEKGQKRTIRGFDQFHRFSRIFGLLLWPDVDKGRGVFRRVGTAYFKTMDDSVHPLEKFGDSFRSYQSGIRDEDFRETDGKGSYTIWLV